MGLNGGEEFLREKDVDQDSIAWRMERENGGLTRKNDQDKEECSTSRCEYFSSKKGELSFSIG